MPLVTSRRVTLPESHLPIFRRALVDGVDPLLVVEDDLDFRPDVGGRGPA